MSSQKSCRNSAASFIWGATNVGGLQVVIPCDNDLEKGFIICDDDVTAAHG